MVLKSTCNAQRKHLSSSTFHANHLNDDEQSGIEKVPKTISATFFSEGEDSKVWSAQKITPWIQPESDDVKMAPLLQLDSGCLQQSSAALLGSHEAGNSV